MLSVYHDLQGKQCLQQFCDLSTCLVITSEETFHFKHHFQHQCKYEYVGATSCGISPPVKKCKLAFLWIKTVLNDNPGWPVHYSMFTGMVSAVYILLLWVCVHVCACVCTGLVSHPVMYVQLTVLHTVWVHLSCDSLYYSWYYYDWHVLLFTKSVLHHVPFFIWFFWDKVRWIWE